MRGRWAAGIVPRNFCWIIKDHLAVSERPGGYAPNHRKVRRHEELLWLRAQGFTRVVSLLASTHNLHAYDELHLEWSRFPIPVASDTREVLSELYPALHGWLRSGERVLLHQEELGDCVMGVVAGYLLWSEILPDGPRAITAMEQLLRRQMGTVGRTIVSVVEEVPSLGSLNHTGERGDGSPGGSTADRRPGTGIEGGGQAMIEGPTLLSEADADVSDEGGVAPPESLEAGDPEEETEPLAGGPAEGEVAPFEPDWSEGPAGNLA
ncbi:MAG: hypothetical protein ACLPUG_19365 [Acidimicrobiales bacterium]|jgi:hypothetical protein